MQSGENEIEGILDSGRRVSKGTKRRKDTGTRREVKIEPVGTLEKRDNSMRIGV